MPNPLPDLGGAISLLTIIPLPRALQPGANWQAGRALIWFPAVGWLIGALVYAILATYVFPRLVTAAVALIIWEALPGFLHLDGLIDCCDGLLSTTSPERRREIMKDPRAGSFGVAGAALVLLVKFAALASLPDPLAALVIPVLARTVMIMPMLLFPAASASGMSALYKAGSRRAWLAAIWLLPIPLIVPRAVLWLIAAAGMTLAFAVWAARRLNGGLTGDVYGATCELVEVLCLILATL